MDILNHSKAHLQIEPLSPLKRLGRYDFGEALFGDSSKVIKRFLEKEDRLTDPSTISLAEQVREFIYRRDNRRKYVDTALDYLKSKQLPVISDYDVILVGAGIHAAAYLYMVKKKNPGLKVLIVEKSPTVCSTFSQLGDSLVLNSPTYSKVGLNSNIVQGHFIQTSDFDELIEKPFPTAKHLYELATMVLFHADADILFNHEITSISKEGGNYALSVLNETISASCLIISNGMGGPISTSFLKDKISQSVVFGDDFISESYKNKVYFESIRNKRIAVVGDGDTANCVMEYLLPLVYPNKHYGFGCRDTFLPSLVYWIGQSARDIQEFFYTNKQRYCHSGGVIEFFWDGDTPFELSDAIWNEARQRIVFAPEKLVSLSHKDDSIELKTCTQNLDVDLVIDCTGRSNILSSELLQNEFEFIEGNIVLYGGQWNEELDHFIPSPCRLSARRIACKLKNENIFFLGSACPLEQLICDKEARNGSFKYQEDRSSLTNSKWSLEHTLPRTVAFAEKYAEEFQGSKSMGE